MCMPGTQCRSSKIDVKIFETIWYVLKETLWSLRPLFPLRLLMLHEIVDLDSPGTGPGISVIFIFEVWERQGWCLWCLQPVKSNAITLDSLRVLYFHDLWFLPSASSGPYPEENLVHPCCLLRSGFLAPQVHGHSDSLSEGAVKKLAQRQFPFQRSNVKSAPFLGKWTHCFLATSNFVEGKLENKTSGGRRREAVESKTLIAVFFFLFSAKLNLAE